MSIFSKKERKDEDEIEAIEVGEDEAQHQAFSQIVEQTTTDGKKLSEQVDRLAMLLKSMKESKK